MTLRCLLAAVLLFFAALSGAEDAPIAPEVQQDMPAVTDDDEQSDAPAAAQEQEEPHPCDDDAEDFHTWVDRYHGALSRGVCWPSRRMDDLFTDYDTLEEESGTLVRIVAGQGWQENGTGFNDSRIRARVELPNTEKRFSLLFIGNDDEEDEIRSAEVDSSRNVRESGFQSALRWAARSSSRINLDLDVGLASEIKIFSRVRYRYRRPVYDDRSRFRYTQEGRWQDGPGWRSRSRFELDRLYGDKVRVRSTSQFELSEENKQDGREWHLFQGLDLFRQLGPRSGVNLYANVEGFTEPVAAVENWKVGVRFRRDIWRKWLYYEVEPFVVWPREENFRRISGVVLRLEAQFGLVE